MLVNDPIRSRLPFARTLGARGVIAFIVAAVGLVSIGCSDMGTEPTTDPGGPNPGPFPIALTGLIPTRTVVGDTVRIAGTGFGDAPGDHEVRFPGSAGPVVATSVQWAESEVVVLVPAGAADGELVVADSTGQSNGLPFSAAPLVISYANDVDPIFATPAYGCKGCHTGQGGGNFVLGTREELLRGDSDHGPAVIRREGEMSPLIQKLRGTADFGAQMPFGGNPLPDDAIRTIADWIDQGTLDN